MKRKQTFVGNDPTGTEWRQLDSPLHGWKLWVCGPNAYNQYGVKLVSIMPRRNKANYSMMWSVFSDRFTSSKDAQIMSLHEMDMYNKLTNFMRSLANEE